MRVTYHISGDKILSEVANVIDEYNDCAIQNNDNWECQYRDGTGFNKFGFTEGKYWEKPDWGDDVKYASRWEYNYVRCKWYQYDYGMLKGTYTCLKTFI